jgi:hypothetical protein
MIEQRYEVEFLRKASQIPSDLWDICFQRPGEGRWWYEAMEQSKLEGQFTFFYGLIKSLDGSVGIAPAFSMDIPVEEMAPKEFLRLCQLVGKIVPAILRQRTLFVGSPILDESKIGLRPHADRRAALLAFQAALEAKAREIRASLILWKDFPESWSADMNWLLQQRGLFRVVSLPNTLLELPSRRKEDYFAAMKRSRRQNLKNKLKRSRERVELSVETIQRPDSKTLDDIFSLFWQTYEKSNSKFERLNRRFFEVFAETPAAIFIILRETVTGEMVAFRLCFDMGERLISLFIGMDYSRPKEWMLFFRLWDAAVDLALLRGFTSIVSGRSSYDVKVEMGHKLVPLNNYCRHRNFFMHAIYRFAAKKIDWASLDAALARFQKNGTELSETAGNID